MCPIMPDAVPHCHGITKEVVKCGRWVPALFAVAAIIIGTGHTVLDTVLKDAQVGAASYANFSMTECLPPISNSIAVPVTR